MGETCAPRALRAAPRAHRVLSACFFGVPVLRIFGQIFRVAGTQWLQGFTNNNEGLHSILLTNVVGVVAAHTPCRGGGGGVVNHEMRA